VKAQVLDVDVEKERISLGIKQLEGDPFAEPGDLSAARWSRRSDRGEGSRHRREDRRHRVHHLHQAQRARRDRSEQRPERSRRPEGRCPRAQFDKKARKVSVSIKALEVAEEKEAIAQFGSSDSGATLGDILGTALKQREKKED